MRGGGRFRNVPIIMIIKGYRVPRKLGEGGMSQIFLAESTRTGQVGALKVLTMSSSESNDLRNSPSACSPSRPTSAFPARRRCCATSKAASTGWRKLRRRRLRIALISRPPAKKAEDSPMPTDGDVTSHYSRGDLLSRLRAALAEDGADPDHPTMDALAPYDQFHGRGMEATLEMAALVQAAPGDHVLDVGSGIGGPARHFATRFGCRVTGIDLTSEFCDVARHLTGLLGLEDKVAFQAANALQMPFADASFDGAYSMNVSMNIADKAGFYREIHRVLKPGGWLVLSELSKGERGEPDYPTPWARSAQTSFLCTPEETRQGLEQAGFDIVQMHSTLDKALEFGARSRAMVDRGERPPHRAVMLIHGELAKEAMRNTARALADGKTVPIEVLSHKRR